MPFLGELCGLATALLWSGSSMTFSRAAKRMGSVNLNISRLVIAAILLVITILIFNIPSPVNNSQVLFLSISGFIGLLFGDSFLFKSYQYNSPRISMLVMSIAPAMTAVVAYFFLNEGLSIISILGMIITLVGIILVVLEGETSNGVKTGFSFLGIFYAFLGAIGQAGALIFARLAFNSGNVNGLVATFIRIAAALVFLVPVAIMFGKFSNPLVTFKRDKKALGFTLLGAFFGPYLGITTSLLSVMHTKIAIASTLMSITPIPLLALVKIFEKEHISIRAIIGTCVAVGGVAILFLR
jgi:drug/metabolite transporter (DMT)-like permease